MDKLTLRNPAHVMPSVWTEDGEECVSDRVFNGWGPKIVRAVNSHEELISACQNLLACIMLKGGMGGAYATFSGDDIRKAEAAIAKARGEA